MMSNRDKYVKAFSQVHASSDISLNQVKMKKSFRLSYAAVAMVALVLVSGGAFAAFGPRIIKEFNSWGNNAKISTVIDEDGAVGTEVLLHTENLTPPVVIEDGRIFFIADDMKEDITEIVSTERPYIHEIDAEDGRVQFIIVGLNDTNIENYGFAEYFVEKDGKTYGYSAMTNIEKDGTGLPWLESAKETLNLK